MITHEDGIEAVAAEPESWATNLPNISTVIHRWATEDLFHLTGNWERDFTGEELEELYEMIGMALDKKKDKLGIHLSHCNIGEQYDNCKYGDENCPALTSEWSWIGERMHVAELAIKRADDALKHLSNCGYKTKTGPICTRNTSRPPGPGPEANWH